MLFLFDLVSSVEGEYDSRVERRIIDRKHQPSVTSVAKHFPREKSILRLTHATRPPFPFRRRFA